TPTLIRCREASSFRCSWLGCWVRCSPSGVGGQPWSASFARGAPASPADEPVAGPELVPRSQRLSIPPPRHTLPIRHVLVRRALRCAHAQWALRRADRRRPADPPRRGSSYGGGDRGWPPDPPSPTGVVRLLSLRMVLRAAQG